jgi:hypothetical protein
LVRITPAMAAGLSDHVWSLEELHSLATACWSADHTQASRRHFLYAGVPPTLGFA